MGSGKTWGTCTRLRRCLHGRLWWGFLMLMIFCFLILIKSYFFVPSHFYEILPSEGCLGALPRQSLAQQIDGVVHLLLTRSDRECYTPGAVSVLQAAARDLDPRLDTDRPLSMSSSLSSSARDSLSNSYSTTAGTVVGGRSQTGTAHREDLAEEEGVRTLGGDANVVELGKDMAHDQHGEKQLGRDSFIRKGSQAESTRRRNVCPEVYNKTARSWSRPKCEGIPELFHVVTIVLIVHNMDADQVSLLVQRVRKIHHVKINILTTNSAFKFSGKEEVEVLHLADSRKLGETLNEMLHTVTTPYVFFGVDLTQFTEHSNLERLIELLDDLDYVDVAGGSVRDESGLWNHGCIQMILGNYKAVYESGYHHSSRGCMFCNYISGPFVVRTTLLQDINFSPKLGEEVLFWDWYTKLLVEGRASMVCPDVMFFGKEAHRPSYNHWLELAEQWTLQRIITEDGKQYDFECKDLGLDCNNMYKTVKNYFLPPCCLDYLVKVLENLQDCLDKQSLPYRLSYGSLLGAVKMAEPLPWDFDIDFQVECRDKPHVHGPRMAACLKSKGCSRPWVVTESYWVISCTDVNIDVGCVSNMTEDLPYEYRDRPTAINYKSRRMRVATNPAKSSRNQYGEGYLRHQTHWRIKPSSKSWSTCPNPYFHSCQDQFPSDGNLAFKWHRVC